MKILILALVLITNGCFKNLNELNSKNKDINELIEGIIQEDVDMILESLNKDANVNFNYYEGKTPLMYACDQGSLDIVKLLIEKGARINSMDIKGKTPLMYACNQGSLSVVKLLIGKGAEVNQEDIDGLTPLLYICKAISRNKSLIAYNLEGTSDTIGILKLLIDNGANINCEDVEGYSPLTYALLSKNSEIIELLIEKGANVNYKNKYGDTSLTYLCNRPTEHYNDVYYLKYKKNNKELINLMIKKSANINQKNIKGDSPLILAVKNQNFELLKHLLEAGADINIYNNSGSNSLLCAINKGAIEIAKFLINRGINISHTDIFGSDALIYASRFGFNEIVEFLIEKGANVNKKDIYGNTALIGAATYNHFETIKLLIGAGAILNLINNSKNNFLYFALTKSNIETIKTLVDGYGHFKEQHFGKVFNEFLLNSFLSNELLLSSYSIHEFSIRYFTFLIETSKHKIDFNYVDENEKSLLINALEKGSLWAVKFIIENGADTNYKDKKGKTPLMFLCQEENLKTSSNKKDLIKLLLKNGANINEKDSNGTTALMISCISGQKEIVELLINNGADIAIESKKRWTALRAACSKGYKEILRFLLEIKFKSNDDEFKELIKLIVFSSRNLDIVGLLLDKLFKDYKKSNILISLINSLDRSNHRNKELLKLILERGIDINERNDNNATPLIIATDHGYEEIVEFLISNGADISAENNKRWTALKIACKLGYKGIVKILLNTKFYSKDNDKREFAIELRLALDNNNLEIVKLLLSKGARLHEEDSVNILLLAEACLKNYKEIVEFLVKNISGYKPESSSSLIIGFFIATERGYKDLANLILDALCCFGNKNVIKNELMILAIIAKKKELLEFLLESGLNVNNQIGKDFYILKAVSSKLKEILLKIGHQLDPKLKLLFLQAINEYEDENISNLLLLAFKKGNLEIVKLLLEKGADIDPANGCALLTLVSNKGHKDIVELLLNKGLDINCKDEQGKTPLILASQNGHIEIVKLLLERGADIFQKDKNGWTPLKHSCINDRKEVAKLLLENYCEVNGELFNDNLLNSIIDEMLLGNIKNNNIENSLMIINKYKDKINFNNQDEQGNTFLHHAALTNNHKLFNELLNNKCNINLLNNSGQNPLYYALSKGNINESFIWYLINKGSLIKGCSYINNISLIDLLSAYNGLSSKLVYEPLTVNLLDNLEINYDDKNKIKEIIKIIKLTNEDFQQEKQMTDYISNVFKLRYRKLNIKVADISTLKIEKEDLIDFELEPDFIVGAAFDLAKEEYYGNDSLENIRKTFRKKLSNIAKVKPPKTIPSVDTSDKEKSEYVKYLTKKRLKRLGTLLTQIALNQREEQLGWIMNHILSNLSCPTGTLEAINYAVNCLLDNDSESKLKDLINTELMLFRITLIEEVARKNLNNNCTVITLDERGGELGRGQGEYNEHMKAYLVDNLSDELKVTGLYEKDFKYVYNKTFIIDKVKELYEERAFNHILNYIRSKIIFNNKITDYLVENIFKNRKLEEAETPTVLHIENFIYDEEYNLTEEAIVALLIHFNFLTY